MHEVFPIAMTYTNWQTYDQICQDKAGFSPLKNIDKKLINPKDIYAFASSWDENLSVESAVLEHTIFSFTTVCSINTLLDFAIDTDLKILHKKTEEAHLVILTGSVKDWYNAIKVCCSQSKTFSVRKTMNNCYEILAQSQFARLWHGLEKQSLKDGSFAWKE